MIGLALMAWLTVLICYGGNWLLGQCMIERPLVVGLVAGLLMGDVKTGVIIGASLEAIFMGAVNIGGAISAEPVTATALAVAFPETVAAQGAPATARAATTATAPANPALDAARLAWEAPATEVFAVLPEAKAAAAEAAGARFYRWEVPRERPDLLESGEVLIRLVTSFATTPQDVDHFLALCAG